MRIRTAVAVLLAVGVSACSSGSDEPEPSPECARLTVISERLTSAQQELFAGGPGSRAALIRVIGELQSVQVGAPVEIRESLGKLVTAFEQAEKALQKPTKRAQKQLAEAAGVLSAEGRTVSEYVLAECDIGEPTPS